MDHINDDAFMDDEIACVLDFQASVLTGIPGFTGGDNFRGVAFDPINDKLYIAGRSSDNIYRINFNENPPYSADVVVEDNG